MNLPEDGKRCEILDGDLVVTASPITRHQRVSRNLLRALDRYVRDQGLGEVCYARFGVDYYRIVDAEAEELQVYNGDGASYPTPVIHRGRGVVYAKPFPDFALDLGTVWE